MLPGIILAAGNSTRMGSPKALLRAPDGRVFVARIWRTMLDAGMSEVAIVTGRDHDAIVGAMRDDAPPALPRIVRNADPSQGQLSSIWVGMDAVVGPEAEGVMMTLVDVPMVEVATVRVVIAAWRRTRAPIVRPAIGDRHGHPVIFDKALLGELRGAPLDAGAKTVVRAHAAEILNVEVADEGCLADIDTPDDYASLSAQS